MTNEVGRRGQEFWEFFELRFLTTVARREILTTETQRHREERGQTLFGSLVKWFSDAFHSIGFLYASVSLWLARDAQIRQGDGAQTGAVGGKQFPPRSHDLAAR